MTALNIGMHAYLKSTAARRIRFVLNFFRVSLIKILETSMRNAALSHHLKMFVLCPATGFFAEVLLGITTSTQRIMSRRLLKYLFGNQDEDYYKLVEYGLRNNPENTFIPACQLATQTLTAFCANPSCNLRGEAILNLRGISFTKRHTPVLPLDESIAVAVNCHDGRESDGVNSSDREYLVLHLVSSAGMPLLPAHEAGPHQT
jgi:hypothetical protein